MNNYFKLYEECFLIKGTNLSAIYNLLDGNVYEIEEIESEMLLLCEKNVSILEISQKLTLELDDVTSIFHRFYENHIGNFYKFPRYTEKFLVDKTWEQHFFLKRPCEIRMAYIVLTSSCEQQCTFCNDDFIKKYPCMGCFTRKNSTIHTSHDEYISALRMLYNIGVTEIYFTGGDILNDWNNNLLILTEAVNLGFEKIFTFIGGARSLPSEIIEQLATLGIHVFVCVEVLNEKEIDTKLLESCCLLPQFSLYTIFSDKIEKSKCIEIATAFSEKYSPLQTFSDRALCKRMLTLNGKKDLHTLSKTSINDFSFKTTYNQCLHGIITVNENGTVGVCPRLSDFTIGKTNDFLECFKRENLDKMWMLNKDKVKKCNSCHLRYICDDCRFIEYQINSDIEGMSTCSL